MNKLDEKVIVDREDLHTAVCYVRQAAFQHEQKGYGTHHALLDLIARLEEQALATDLTPRQLLKRVRELEAEKQDMLSVLQNIGVYGCGMLSQPAAMNATEESWLRMRIQEMEFVAREAFFKYRGQEAAIGKHGEGV